jgi:hypothetical protein
MAFERRYVILENLRNQRAGVYNRRGPGLNQSSTSPARYAKSGLLFYNRWVDSFANMDAWGTEMTKKPLKVRPWTKEDVRMLKGLAREKTKTTVIARKLKRSVGATHQKAMRLGVTLGGGRRNRR